jgi:hypothetical protein
MRKNFLHGILLPLTIGWMMTNFVSPAKTASADESAIAAVIAADYARGVALVAADTNTLAKLLADDLRYTHSDGKLESKTAHIGAIVGGLRYASFATSNVTGQIVTPDVVVLTGIIDQRKGIAGKWKDSHLMFHAVWRRKPDEWQLASLQTAVPPLPEH